MSERQIKTAIRVANVPADEFERQVESSTPPTVTALAKQGTKPAPRPVIDLKGRDPGEFNRALHFIAEFEDYARTDAGMWERYLPLISATSQVPPMPAINRPAAHAAQAIRRGPSSPTGLDKNDIISTRPPHIRASASTPEMIRRICLSPHSPSYSYICKWRADRFRKLNFCQPLRRNAPKQFQLGFEQC